MDPNQQQLLLTSGGAKDKTYIDEVFDTYTYIGNGQERTITTGIDLAGEGGLLWFKNRDNSNQANYLNDTTALPQTSSPWYSYPMFSNSTTQRGASANGLKSFNSDGFTIQTDTHCNGNGNKQVAWSFRKAPGFFDIVTYSGDGTASRDIAHNLGCIPGMIILKRTDSTSHWWVYHRNLGRATSDWAKVCQLDEVSAQIDSQTVLGATSHQNASTFRIGNGNSMNAGGGSYVAYLFAGGASTAATSRSVDFDGQGDYLGFANTGSNGAYQLGTGDFTVEFWWKADSTTQGNWNQVIGTQSTGGTDTGLWRIGTRTNANKIYFSSATGGGFDEPAWNANIDDMQWHHVAITRASGYIYCYVDGEKLVNSGGTNNITRSLTTSNSLFIGYNVRDGNYINGKLSNVRIVKGTAVYTTSFNPIYNPLTDITNTTLLCCNNSSVTGGTVLPVVPTSYGNTAASTESPFDDPEGFNFGESGNVVKCGSYMGNTSTSPEINLGWEPQLVIFKQKGGSGNWSMFDNVRGMNAPLEEHYLYPNLENAEYTAERLEITQRGFRIDTGAGTLINTNNEEYIYLAIRRSDGYVGKPPEAGSDAFAMDVGNGANPGPTFDPSGSTFKVGMRLLKNPAGSGNWYIGTRKRDHRQLHTNTTASEVTGTYTDFTYPAGEGNTWSSSYQAWMWKRYAGFDVASYIGNGKEQRQIQHSMGISPEMIWIKDATSSYDWQVWHKDLTSGYHLRLNSSDAETTSNTPGLGTLDSVSFNIGSYVGVNQNTNEYVAYLFSSVDGISKVGSYSGSSYDYTINLGFTPRFLVIKAYNSSSGSQRWTVFDSLRGMGAGSNDKRVYLNNADGQQTGDYITSVSATGITMRTNFSYTNSNGNEYIYYAHA